MVAKERHEQAAGTGIGKGARPLHHRIEHAIEVSDEQLARIAGLDQVMVEADVLREVRESLESEDVTTIREKTDLANADVIVGSRSRSRYQRVVKPCQTMRLESLKL